MLFYLVYQEVFSHFPTIPDHFGKCPKTTEHFREEMRNFSTPQVSQNTVEHGSNKRDHSPFEHRLKVHGPIFEEQVDRKWGFWLIDLGNFRKLGQDF